MTSISMISERDPDSSPILTQNKNLQAELLQCQADKEFVWSLWKRLQVSNPDVTEAISIAIQREKEKCEIKDRKVLEILQNKDNRIEELLSKIEKQSKQLKESLTKRVDFQEDNGRLEAERNHLQDKVSALQIQVQALETREKSFDEIHKKTLEATEREKQEFQRRTIELTKELDLVRNEKSEHLSTRIQVEATARSFERELAEKNVKIERLNHELEESEKIIKKYVSELQSTKHDLHFKTQELEIVRKELSDLWISHNELTEYSSQQADLVRQLQSLQNDTQKMLKNQEAAYSIESHSVQQIYGDINNRYEQLKKSESELRKQVLRLKKELLDKENFITQLQDNLRSKNKPQNLDGSFIDRFKDGEPVLDYEYKIECMKKEIDLLKDKLTDKNRIITELDNTLDHSIEFDVSKLNKGERTHSTPSREHRSVATSPIRLLRETKHRTVSRSHSCSPTRNTNPNSQLLNTRKKLDDTEHLLHLKTKELSDLRKVHNKRLERLKSLQASYKTVKDQLKTLEDEQNKKKKVRRSDPRSLTKEDSDGVWNELNYFKRENRNLAVENMNMQEEIDMLRVQASHDAAAIHELQLALEQDREEHDYEIKKLQFDNKDRTELETQLHSLNSQLQSKEILIRKLEKDVREGSSVKDLLIEEKRNLKSELLNLRRETADYRMTIANLKRDTSRLKREIDESNQSSKISEKDGVKSSSPDSSSDVKMSRGLLPRLPVYRINKRRTRSKPSKQYQRALNRSIEKMSAMFSNFNEEDWEEVSESAEVEEETDLTGSDMLGRAIVSASREQVGSKRLSDGQSSNQTDSSTGYKRQNSSPLRSMKSRTDRRIAGSSPLSRDTRSSESLESVTESSSNENMNRVVMREMATSPITVSGGRLPSSRPKRINYHYNVPASRQLGPLKQRVNYLQQQVNTLRESRGNALKTVGEQKEMILQLQTDLNLANQRLKMTKMNIQKVTNHLDKLQKDKIGLEGQLSAREESCTTSVTGSPNDKQTENGVKSLEVKLRASSAEIARQAGSIKSLKLENEQLQEQVKKLTEKINHVERDNNQKRNLLESQRTKLKNLQDKAKTDSETIVELETKIKLLNESSDRTKIQLESLKKRISAVSKDKKEADETNIKLISDVEKMNKQLNETSKKYTNLESAMVDLEDTAKEQLHGLASQSEAAIDSVQVKLIETHEKVLKYEQFVKMLSCEILSRVEEGRREINDKLTASQRAKAPKDPTLEQAKAIAQDLFNLSQSDIEELMIDDNSTPKSKEAALAQKRNDKRWIKKCEKILHSQEFVEPLVKLLVEKIDERSDLIKQMTQTK
ncbi:centlein isoform X2 [Patella vulgata]|uniref:centlein isoform X2 n=1 Tax=Patella vulgata TaxID=6465 RepID=UPI0021806CA3|nr:centlein isoform X2 [Patella vulgata]